MSTALHILVWFMAWAYLHDNTSNHRAGGGGSLISQVEHHLQDKFASPLLYGIDNFICMIFF